MKKNSVVALVASLSTVAILGATIVQAEEVVQDKKSTSDATITLEPGDVTTPPEIIEETKPDGSTGNTGTLTIDNLSPFQFGKHQLTGGGSVYTITAESANVQVTDKRGTGAGWQLQVTASAFKDQADQKKVLKGATVTIPAGEVATTADGNISGAPKASEVVLEASEKGTAATLFQAEENTGMGSWANKFDPNGVKLLVPGGNFVGEYTSVLTWTLGDTPQG